MLTSLMARGVNLLVLDEPTNHLDLPAIEQLEQALAAFGATLVLVSHDRRLLKATTLHRTIDVVVGQATNGLEAMGPSGPTWREARRREGGRMQHLWSGKGDDGTTGLYFCGRVAKDGVAPEAMGSVDNAQSTARSLTDSGGQPRR